MRAQVSRLALAVGGVALLVACGSDDPTCGPGTREAGGKCVPSAEAPTCGAATSLQGSVCVPDPSALADAAPDASPKPDTSAKLDTGPELDTAAADVVADTGSPDTAAPDTAAAGADADDTNVADAHAGDAVQPADTDSDAFEACDPPCEGTATCVNGTCQLCKPACDFKQCGNDGCGGSCGTCPQGALCLLGQCALVPTDASCKSICGGVTTSGCSCKGDCKVLGTCCVDFDQVCGCVGLCTGKQCGNDGCGGSCGVCPTGKLCSANQCVDDPCHPDPCSGHGACSGGKCTCKPSFVGQNCAQCAAGLVNYPKCTADKCGGLQKTCSGHGKCAPVDGSCTCDLGFKGDKCEQCAVPGNTWPKCPNPCVGVQCDDGNPCTDDTCTAAGKCAYIANAIACDDGNPCSIKDRCKGGSCGGVKACDLAVNVTGDADDGGCSKGHCSLREAIAAANADSGATTIGFVGNMGIALKAALPIIKAPLTLDGGGHKIVIDGNGKLPILRGAKNLKLVGLTLQGGKAKSGGAVHLTGGSLHAEDVRFLGNVATGSGGAVRALATTLKGCTFAGNRSLGVAKQDGGGAVQALGALEIDRCIFANNQATNDGGAVHALSAGGKVLRSSAVANSARVGGAFRVTGAKFVNSTMTGNTAKTSGGAVSDGGGGTLLHCTLVANSAPAGSGLSGATTTLQNSLIAGGKGGAECELDSGAVAAGNLIGDGSCKATLKGDPGTLAFGAWGGSTPTIPLAAKATPIDAATDAGCGDPDVKGADQRGVARPQGKHCDLGAFERKGDPCVGAKDKTACSDGDPCTVGDVCKGGTCKAGKKDVCDDGNACTKDECTRWGGCGHGRIVATCDDGNPCTTSDFCGAGACVPGAVKGCDDANTCTVDSCDPAKGCAHKTAAGSCDDGDPCTHGDVCKATTCAAGQKVCNVPKIAGLTAHYSASVAGAVVTDKGGQVTLWKDLSGKGRHLKPHGAGPVLDPLGVLGTPALDFAGNKGMKSPPMPLKAEMTLMMVVRIGKTSNWGCLAHHGSRDHDWSLEQNGLKPKDQVHFQSNNDNSTGDLSLLSGNVYVLAARISGGKRMFTATQTTTVGTTAIGSTIKPGNKVLYIGRSDIGESSQVAIGELLYFDRALSDTERAVVVTYLRAAWRFALPKPDLLWLDASDAKSVQLGKAGQVAKWLSHGGMGNAVSSGAAPPVYSKTSGPGGRPAVLFNAKTASLQTAPLATAGQLTLVAVASLASKPGGVMFAQGGEVTLLQAAGSKAKLHWRIGAAGAGPQAALKAGAWHVITAVEDATVATLQIGADSPVTAAVGGAPSKAKLIIGNNAKSGAVMGGSIAELRLFSTALAPLDRAAVAAQCAGRWGGL